MLFHFQGKLNLFAIMHDFMQNFILQRQKKSLARDFSDGVLAAEIIKVHTFNFFFTVASIVLLPSNGRAAQLPKRELAAAETDELANSESKSTSKIRLRHSPRCHRKHHQSRNQRCPVVSFWTATRHRG